MARVEYLDDEPHPPVRALQKLDKVANSNSQHDIVILRRPSCSSAVLGALDYPQQSVNIKLTRFFYKEGRMLIQLPHQRSFVHARSVW